MQARQRQAGGTRHEESGEGKRRAALIWAPEAAIDLAIVWRRLR